ncbi:MAG: type III-B CRISPR module RAMP protein Cmr6, partial [Zoogloeaceae bacterium]|nr:type III-B CRISPR module RAMP protein Cmr6 [Zoogloeaceae bacterium]
HQSHYYQKNTAAGSVTPHESGQPNPISFLTVPPKSGFTFYVQCDNAHLQRLAPELAENERWRDLITAALEHAFEWLGFGAKTSVGYGAMQQPPEEPAAVEEIWSGARVKFNHRNGALTVEKNGQSAIALAPKGAELLHSLPVDIQRKIQTGQFVKITAHVAEGTVLRIQMPEPR